MTAVTAVTLLAAKAVAQDSSTSTTATTAAAQPAAASQSTPVLSYGVSQVVQLAHANIGEDVIVNYIQNSGNAYGLDANQILYLKQQGVSDRIINTMLGQRSRVAAAAQTAPPPNNPDASSAQIPTTTPPPAVSYVQTAPPQTVYVIPDTQTYNYYAYSIPILLSLLRLAGGVALVWLGRLLWRLSRLLRRLSWLLWRLPWRWRRLPWRWRWLASLTGNAGHN